MVAPVIIAAAVAAIGGLISSAIQAGNMAEARRLLEEGKQRFGELALPEFDDLEKMVAEAEAPTRSAMLDIAPESGNLAAAQEGSIAQMGEWAKPGITDAERFMMSRSLGEIQRRNAADRASLENQARSAGGFGAGQTLALAQRAQSQNANQQADVALGAGAQAQARALAALRDRYSMAANRSRDVYGRGRDSAQATDALNQANARFSLTKAGLIGDMRQRGFENDYRRTAGMAGRDDRLAGQARDEGQMYGGAAAGMGEAGGRFAYDWLSRPPDEEQRDDASIPYYLRR